METALKNLELDDVFKARKDGPLLKRSGLTSDGKIGAWTLLEDQLLWLLPDVIVIKLTP